METKREKERKESRPSTPPARDSSPDNSNATGGSGSGSISGKVTKSQRKRDKKVTKEKEKNEKIEAEPMDKMAEGGGGGNNREDENTWDCTVCTYKNPAEAFKCLMCDVRKGTSTRKPRINPELVAQQVARQQQHLLLKISHGRTKDGNGSGRESREGSRDGSRDGRDKDGDHNSREKINDPIKEGNGKESSGRVDSDSGPETKRHSSSHKQNKHRKNLNHDGNSLGTSNSHIKSNTIVNNNNNNNHNHNNNTNNIKSSSSSNISNNFSSEAVTVNNVTVIITEFQKDLKDRSPLSLPFSQLN
ncbi:RING1 and YY1-binding protein-like [Panonychus citri]|uniref:RING1 and YY1-binding protein-like n=1 Tax=Panonychus citri TaxID=50023 RepID=UPI002306E608|nr:RING1 and YY1-binding protein-like [Panonychus citri]XP_053212509.1 RING1 and YY1-binding protein-like [Panonychus citri]XP_053214074.1 RING1 and YY1-binding protein-like [Panonychus citri]